MSVKTIALREIKIHQHHLDLLYTVDEFSFTTKIFYHDLDLNELDRRYGDRGLDRLYAHIALFEGMKFCSLYPEKYDISIISDRLCEDALTLFNRIYCGVFAQHWYENNVGDYRGPQLIYDRLGTSEVVELGDRNDIILAACGGGKDSIVAMKMLEEANLPFASFQYSHSIYGQSNFQHRLISRVLKHVRPVRSHQISIYDDFLDCPFVSLYFPQLSGITVPETPVSVFESLILMLAGGYRYLSLAHEKSANTGNLVSDSLGEVNHQWGKSYEAEIELNRYIQTNLFSNLSYFGILQPIYEYRIFEKLTQYPEVLGDIHSCNIEKPWCKKCPKCAYVWTNLMAFFDPDLVDAVFGKNLFDDPDLLPVYEQMLGLTEHTPFECLGEIDETRLAVKSCVEKGLTGKAIDLFRDLVLSDEAIDWEGIAVKYRGVYDREHAIPEAIFMRIADKF
jgi:hypothetical protein